MWNVRDVDYEINGMNLSLFFYHLHGFEEISLGRPKIVYKRQSF